MLIQLLTKEANLIKAFVFKIYQTKIKKSFKLHGEIFTHLPKINLPTPRAQEHHKA